MQNPKNLEQSVPAITQAMKDPTQEDSMEEFEQYVLANDEAILKVFKAKQVSTQSRSLAVTQPPTSNLAHIESFFSPPELSSIPTTSLQNSIMIDLNFYPNNWRSISTSPTTTPIVSQSIPSSSISSTTVTTQIQVPPHITIPKKIQIPTHSTILQTHTSQINTNTQHVHNSHASTSHQTNPLFSNFQDTNILDSLLASIQVILDRLQKLKVSNQDPNHCQTYEQLCNEPIHPSVPYYVWPNNFELPKFDKFKGKEDPKDHLKMFKHECYLINHIEL